MVKHNPIPSGKIRKLKKTKQKKQKKKKNKKKKKKKKKQASKLRKEKEWILNNYPTREKNISTP